ncbi:MAG: DUF2812 domain-containing protein [Clostridium sp.]
MKIIKRLFWSINILKTEKWLEDMSLNGYILKEIQGFSSFIFEEGTPKKLSYRLLYKTRFIPKSLEKDNWKLCYCKNNFTVLYNNSEHLLDVDRQPIISRIHTIRNSILIPYCIYISFSIIPLTLLFGVFSTNSVEIVYMPFWWIGPILFLSVHLIIIYTLLTLTKIINVIRTSSSITNFDKTNKNKSLKGNTIRKFKLGWLYSPDMMESYLESMESKGYNLKTINFFGNGLTFFKGSPRNIKYCVDYQTKVSSDYFSMYKSEDWTLCYKTSDIIGNYFIWSKEYYDSRDIPNIYTDSESKIKTAQRILIKFSCIFLPCIFIFSLILTQIYSIKSSSYVTVLYVVILFEYLILYIKVLSYYLRVRKTALKS